MQKKQLTSLTFQVSDISVDIFLFFNTFQKVLKQISVT